MNSNDWPASKQPASQWGGQRKGSGRKRLPERQRQKLHNLRVSDLDWEKLKVLGGAKWVREQVAKARVTPSQESELRDRLAPFNPPAADDVEQRIADLESQLQELKKQQAKR